MDLSPLTNQPVSMAVLLISVGVPVYLVWQRKFSYLIAWIAIGACVEIFNNLVFVSLTSIKICGIVLIPYAAKRCRELCQVTPGQMWVGLSALLAVLGLYFGFVDPWPDYTGVRSLRQLPQGRSVLYLGSYFLEMVVAIFLAFELRKSANLVWLVRGLLIGGTLCVVGVSLERLFQYDFYYIFTGYDAREISYRSRGFNYEPRGVGYTATIVLLLAMAIPMRFWRKLLVIGGLYIAFYFAGSLSSVIMLSVSSVVVALCLWVYRHHFPLHLRSFATGCLALVLVALSFFTFDKISGENIWSRSYRLKDRAYLSQYQAARERAERDLGEVRNLPVLKLFEVFDAAALNFFRENPKHLVFGTGPGLMSLAASHGRRIDSLPHIGVLRKISDFGLLGFLIWLAMLFTMTKKLFTDAKKDQSKNQNAFRLILFAILSLCYGLQAKVFYIFIMGLGIAPFLDSPKLEQSAQKSAVQ